jgi:hypothetical protein
MSESNSQIVLSCLVAPLEPLCEFLRKQSGEAQKYNELLYHRVEAARTGMDGEGPEGTIGQRHQQRQEGRLDSALEKPGNRRTEEPKRALP